MVGRLVALCLLLGFLIGTVVGMVFATFASEARADIIPNAKPRCYDVQLYNTEGWGGKIYGTICEKVN